MATVLDVFKQPDGPIDLLSVLEAEKYRDLLGLVAEGVYPPDTLLRLDSIGDYTYFDDDGEQLIRPRVLDDLVTHSDDQTKLSVFTQSLLFGEEPKALLVWNQADVARINQTRDLPYILKTDLADVIEARRVDQGKTVKVVPEDRRWRPPELVERAQCMRIAHGLWKVLARRVIPQWVDPNTVAQFYRTHKNGTTIYEASDGIEVQRSVIGAIALRADHIRAIYDESQTHNVVGIGPVGKTDLRELLSDVDVSLK